MRLNSSRVPIRARIHTASFPDHRGVYPTEVILEGTGGRFPINEIDVVLRQLVKVRDVIA